MTHLLWPMVPVLVVLIVTVMLWRRRRSDWRPHELQRGRIVMIEETLHVEHPYRIVGRPDQVVQLADGLHVPVDAKNRNRFQVYPTDVAELSLQAWMLRRRGLATAAHGYLAVTDRQTKERRALRVELGDDRYCERLIERFLLLIDGRVTARRMSGPKCASCGQRARC